jgi:hypothetical protein
MRTVMISPAVSIPRERRATLRKRTEVLLQAICSQDSCTIGNSLIWVDGEEVGNKLTSSIDVDLGEEYYERYPGTALRSIEVDNERRGSAGFEKRSAHLYTVRLPVRVTLTIATRYLCLSLLHSIKPIS